MAILPDHRLRAFGPLMMTPYDPSWVQPASIDVHLDRYFIKSKLNHSFVIDPNEDNGCHFSKMVEVPPGCSYLIEPGGFVLASTFQTLRIPEKMVARFEGKSSLGRLGLLTHITAGFIDPGFNGHVTVELSNVTDLSIRLYPGMKIGQICFEEMEYPASRPYGHSSYGSHYQGQRGPTLSRIHQNFHTIDVYGEETQEKKEVENGDSEHHS